MGLSVATIATSGDKSTSRQTCAAWRQKAHSNALSNANRCSSSCDQTAGIAIRQLERHLHHAQRLLQQHRITVPSVICCAALICREGPQDCTAALQQLRKRCLWRTPRFMF